MGSKGTNGKGPQDPLKGSKIHVDPVIRPLKSVPRYSTSGAEDRKFGFQDGFNPFCVSRFSTSHVCSILRGAMVSRSVSFLSALDEAWMLNVPMRPPMPRDIASWPATQYTRRAHS